MSSSILKFLFPLSGNLLPWILSYRSYFYPLWSYEIHHTSPWESRNIWRQLSWSLWLSPPPPFLFLMWFPTPHSPATISLPGSRVWVRVLDSEWEHFGITWRDFSKETCSLSILCIPRISNTPFGVHKGRSVCTLKTYFCFLLRSKTIRPWSVIPWSEHYSSAVIWTVWGRGDYPPYFRYYTPVNAA